MRKWLYVLYLVTLMQAVIRHKMSKIQFQILSIFKGRIFYLDKFKTLA